MTNEFTALFDYTSEIIRADALYHLAIGATLIIGVILDRMSLRRVRSGLLLLEAVRP